MTLTMDDGTVVEVELKFGPSTRVQSIDGSWVTHLGITPVIVGGGPEGSPDGGGEPLPIEDAA